MFVEFLFNYANALCILSHALCLFVCQLFLVKTVVFLKCGC